MEDFFILQLDHQLCQNLGRTFLEKYENFFRVRFFSLLGLGLKNELWLDQYSSQNIANIFLEKNKNIFQGNFFCFLDLGFENDPGSPNIHYSCGVWNPYFLFLFGF